MSTSNPITDVSAPKAKKRLPGNLDADRMARLLDIPGEGPLVDRDRAILELLYSSGLRLSELTGLNLGDVDMQDATVQVTGKGNKDRIIPGRQKSPDSSAAMGLSRAEMAAAMRRHCSSVTAAAESALGRCRPGFSTGLEDRALMPTSTRTCSAIPSLPTCSNPAMTCVAFRSCWDTPISPQLRCIRTLISSIWPRYTTKHIRGRARKASQ